MNAPAEKTMPVEFLRGYYPADGSEKIPAGTTADLPISEAKAAIAANIAIRADKLPD